MAKSFIDSILINKGDIIIPKITFEKPFITFDMAFFMSRLNPLIDSLPSQLGNESPCFRYHQERFLDYSLV